MLSDKEFNILMSYSKTLVDSSPIYLPEKGKKYSREIKSLNSKDKFLLSINRGRVELNKITYLNKFYDNSTILLRLDTAQGGRHINPDGTFIPCPHLHIYTEDYGDKFAIPLDPKLFSNTNDLAILLRDFLTYFNVNNIPEISYCDKLC